VLVDNGTAHVAPVVFEDNPTFVNLVGRFDHIAHMGTLATNFTLIKAGALHRANGGYLMLDVAKLVAQPYAWEGLKRTLKAGSIRIESLAQVFGWMSTLPLDPEPVPLDVKVVLFGERIFYYLLREYDPEFDELFKIAADFENDVERDGENTALYARLVATLARAHGVRALDRAAVARVVEYGARLAGDAGRLSARLRRISDLLQEADHGAGVAGRDRIQRQDIEQALAARIRRADRPATIQSPTSMETSSRTTNAPPPDRKRASRLFSAGEGRSASFCPHAEETAAAITWAKMAASNNSPPAASAAGPTFVRA